MRNQSQTCERENRRGMHTPSLGLTQASDTNAVGCGCFSALRYTSLHVDGSQPTDLNQDSVCKVKISAPCRGTRYLNR